MSLWEIQIFRLTTNVSSEIWSDHAENDTKSHFLSLIADSASTLFKAVLIHKMCTQDTLNFKN